MCALLWDIIQNHLHLYVCLSVCPSVRAPILSQFLFDFAEIAQLFEAKKVTRL